MVGEKTCFSSSGNVKCANMSAGFWENVTKKKACSCKPPKEDLKPLAPDAHESVSLAVCSCEERRQEK